MAVERTPAADRLRRILQFERLRGCADSTVIGGVDALLRNLLAPAAGDPAPIVHTAVKLLGHRTYAALAPQARRAWIDQVLELASTPTAVRPEPPAAVQRRPGLSAVSTLPHAPSRPD